MENNQRRTAKLYLAWRNICKEYNQESMLYIYIYYILYLQILVVNIYKILETATPSVDTPLHSHKLAPLPTSPPHTKKRKLSAAQSQLCMYTNISRFSFKLYIYIYI